MENSLFSEFTLAIWSVIVGAFLCAVYDIFRLFRLCRKQNALVLFICDLLFSIIAAVSVILLFFNLSHGKMRAYSLALTAVGFLLWRFTVSRFVMAVMKRLISALNRFLNMIKMRVFGFVRLNLRRIYTFKYCRSTLAAARRFKTKGK